jgi:UDP-glucose:(glucosyl)LPS alpha-1,2-glucosyltransferase
MSGFEENEISENANGGTEIAKRRLAQLIPSDVLDHFQIVSSRIRNLYDDKIRIFYAHDLPQDPESSQLKDEVFRKKFHKIVFISDWQYEQYRMVLGIPYSEHSVVIESGIDPVDVDLLGKPKDVVNCVYTSTPQRGLDILVPVFDKVSENFDTHLHVFSSYKLYGWADRDQEFEPLFDVIRNHPKMTYHEVVPNEELKEFLKNAHIFAYPCTWPETSCRAMIEAMSAGLVCVHPNYAALPLTSGGMNFMYNGDQDKNKHASLFAHALVQGIQLVKTNDTAYQNRIMFNKHFADTRFHIDKIKFQWEGLLKELLHKFPTGEMRKVPEKIFSYQTIQR